MINIDGTRTSAIVIGDRKGSGASPASSRAFLSAAGLEFADAIMFNARVKRTLRLNIFNSFFRHEPHGTNRDFNRVRYNTARAIISQRVLLTWPFACIDKRINNLSIEVNYYIFSYGRRVVYDFRDAQTYVPII